MSAATPLDEASSGHLSLTPPANPAPPPAPHATPLTTGPQHDRLWHGYGRYLARLVVLVAAFAAGVTLNYLSAGHPYFVFVVLGGVLLACVSVVALPRSPLGAVRLTVPLFDLAWIMFAMYLTAGLQSVLLPLLYIIVAVAAMRGDRWEAGTTLAGALTGIFVLAGTHQSGANLSLAAAQATLLAAGALAVRLVASADQTQTAPALDADTRTLYESLLQATSDAVINLDPENWSIADANPAAVALLNGEATTDQLLGRPLDEVLHFGEAAFLRACKRQLKENDYVRGATTQARTSDGRELTLVFNLTPARVDDELAFIQAVISVTSEDLLRSGATGWLGADFATHYIPSLTHELNNHLAAIRLSAELAETTGRTPDFVAIQSQVDHCQEVLQTVVMQILRAGAPERSGATTPTSELRQVIEHALLLTRPQVLTSGVQLQLRVTEGDLPVVKGFNYELQEALVRLILYSVQAMSDREHPRVLTLAAEEREGVAEVTLTDLGPGLKWNELAAINGHGVPTPRAEQRVWNLVREGVTRFGGSLTASNGLNGGARFKITLPIAETEVKGRGSE